MPKVSIIIPFNNVENYIEQCIKSVLNQTLNDIEIIFINDGSKDKSRDIVQKYVQIDNRIKILDLKEQQGQGYARNRGIELAKGEYIGFVDSDDFVEINMFEELYNRAKGYDNDITMCLAREFDDITSEYITSNYYDLEILGYLGNKVFNSYDTRKEILDINAALWNKIYKRDFLISTGEKLPESVIYEDLPFFFGTYLKAQRISIVHERLYNYRINRKTSTMNQFNDKILDRIPMVSLSYEKIKTAPFFEEIKQNVQGWIINDLFHRYIILKENYHREFFFMMKKVFQNLDIDDINDSYWNSVYHFKGYLLVINNTFENFTQKVFKEYLDIHEIEHRLRTETVKKDEFSWRLSCINTDIKDLSYVLHDNYVELGKELELLKERENDLKNQLDDQKKSFDRQIKILREEYLKK